VRALARAEWIDLSGNARIVAPPIRVIVEGKPNRFKTGGQPRSVFAPKSARLVRWLLVHADGLITQREIARATCRWPNPRPITAGGMRGLGRR
jgi:hypothetical protein